MIQKYLRSSRFSFFSGGSENHHCLLIFQLGSGHSETWTNRHAFITSGSVQTCERAQLCAGMQIHWPVRRTNFVSARTLEWICASLASLLKLEALFSVVWKALCTNRARIFYWHTACLYKRKENRSETQL